MLRMSQRALEKVSAQIARAVAQRPDIAAQLTSGGGPKQNKRFADFLESEFAVDDPLVPLIFEQIFVALGESKYSSDSGMMGAKSILYMILMAAAAEEDFHGRRLPRLDPKKVEEILPDELLYAKGPGKKLTFEGEEVEQIRPFLEAMVEDFAVFGDSPNAERTKGIFLYPILIFARLYHRASMDEQRAA